MTPEVAEAAPPWSNAAPDPCPGHPERDLRSFPRLWEGMEEEMGHREIPSLRIPEGVPGLGLGLGLPAALAVENETLNAFKKLNFIRILPLPAALAPAPSSRRGETPPP